MDVFTLQLVPPNIGNSAYEITRPIEKGLNCPTYKYLFFAAAIPSVGKAFIFDLFNFKTSIHYEKP